MVVSICKFRNDIVRFLQMLMVWPFDSRDVAVRLSHFEEGECGTMLVFVCSSDATDFLKQAGTG